MEVTVKAEKTIKKQTSKYRYRPLALLNAFVLAPKFMLNFLPGDKKRLQFIYINKKLFSAYTRAIFDCVVHKPTIF